MVGTARTGLRTPTRRRIGVAALVLIGLGLATALVTPASGRTYLDPDAPTPGGARALAEILRAQGASVERTTDASRALSAAAGTTVVVAYPELLGPADVGRLEASPADVVLLGAPAQVPAYLGITVSGVVDVEVRDPECELPAATAAGAALTGGISFTAQSDPRVDGFSTTGCYPAPSGTTLVQVTTASGSRHTVVGSADFMTNDRLADDGNAALALNTIGTQPQVLWWLPTPQYTGTQSLTTVLPDAVWPVLGAAVVVVLSIAVWQARRLGPVVVEPLPVTVRASETTEGRAQIYQRYRTRDRAAHHLRRHTEARLRRLLGLPAGGADALVAAAAHATGRAEDDVRRLLYGPAPRGDDDLVALAQQLYTLEQEAGR